MKMNISKYKNENSNEYYTNSIRTSGEVAEKFVRDVKVICKLILFIDANVQYLFKPTI